MIKGRLSVFKPPLSPLRHCKRLVYDAQISTASENLIAPSFLITTSIFIVIFSGGFHDYYPFGMIPGLTILPANHLIKKYAKINESHILKDKKAPLIIFLILVNGITASFYLYDYENMYYTGLPPANVRYYTNLEGMLDLILNNQTLQFVVITYQDATNMWGEEGVNQLLTSLHQNQYKLVATYLSESQTLRWINLSSRCNIYERN